MLYVLKYVVLISLAWNYHINMTLNLAKRKVSAESCNAK
ncbi:hypothetical protein H376_6310 [Rickettsia prowazekii str. GvF12]|nr:hypothetical protein H376_6310 [Rickettsia prowazekii str. GvF12]